MKRPVMVTSRQNVRLYKGKYTGNGTKTYRLLFFPMAERMSRLCKSQDTGNGTKTYRLLFFPMADRMSRLCKGEDSGNGTELTACCSFPWQTRCPDSARANILVMVPNLPLAVLSHGRQDVQTLQGRSLTKDDQYQEEAQNRYWYNTKSRTEE
jgi:hypothetical protein